jgi:hypothetical protein
MNLRAPTVPFYDPSAIIEPVAAPFLDPKFAPPGQMPEMPASAIPATPGSATAGRDAFPETDFGSTGKMLKSIVKNYVRSIPDVALKFLIFIVLLGGSYLFLMTVQTWTLPGPIVTVVSVLIFLTASWNNAVAKIVYISLILTTGRYFFKRFKKEGVKPVVSEFKSVVPRVKENWSELKDKALWLFLCFGGIGMALSNYLSRNNKIDKYVVSLMLAISLSSTIAKGAQNLSFLFYRVVTRDIAKLFKHPDAVNNAHITIAYAGAAAGLLGAAVFAVIGGAAQSAFTDNMGYFLGGAAVVAGIALMIVNRSKARAVS